jgi:hypothetical protein
MRYRRLAVCLVCPVLLLGVGPGCLSPGLDPYRPVVIQARDAETKQPLPDTAVRISYPVAGPATAPQVSAGSTDDYGLARLWAAPCGDGGILVEATASGYLCQTRDLSPEEVEALPLPSWFEAVERRPVSFTLDLYKAPNPTVELLLPEHFRGPLRVEVVIREDAPCRPGQRVFRCQVPESGTVQVVGPPLLRHLPEFRAVTADGTVLSRQPKSYETGFWWLRNDEKCQVFLVGTAAEYAELRPAEPAHAEETRPADAGKGQGRGQRGRRGPLRPGDLDTD